LSRKTQNIREENCPEFTTPYEWCRPSKMQVFHCSCGEIILIVPDIRAMNTALKNHLTKHVGQHITEETLICAMLRQLANRYFQIMEKRNHLTNMA